MYALTAASVAKVSLIVPRGDLDSSMKRLAEFEWFHPEPVESPTPDATLDALNRRIYNLHLELEDIAKALGLKVEPGIIEILTKGYKAERTEFTVWTRENLVDKLETESRPIIEELKRIVSQLNENRKVFSDGQVLEATLQLVSHMEVDLTQLQKFRRLHSVFAVVSAKDLREIRRSLPEEIVVDSPVTKSEYALLIAAPKEGMERVERVLRGFEIKSFAIPEGLPQSPAKAYAEVRRKVAAASSIIQAMEVELQETQLRFLAKLLALREGAEAVYKALNQVRKTGDFKWFAVIQGFIPAASVSEFEKRNEDSLCLIEEVHPSGHGGPVAPSITSNRGYRKAFEKITFTQGPPAGGEIDPTSMISFFFPFFYGFMFADLGQGLVLFLLGLILRIRGTPSLKHWGTIIAAAGITGAVMGVLVGEFFGVEISHIPGLADVFERFLILHVSEMSEEVVVKLLITSILIGVFHQTLGFTLDVVKGFKLKENLELISAKIPTLAMYLAGFFFALSFIGSGYSFNRVLTSSNPTPLFSEALGVYLPSGAVASFSIPIILVSLLFLVFGKAVARVMGKYHEETLVMSIILGVVEFILRVVEFLANSVSYARLGILMLVHTALLLLVKLSLEQGIIGLPIAIMWNISVMLIEGLIVYIQDVRLHVYEWFTKFYQGTGRLFEKLMPQTLYVDIKWEKTSGA